MKGKSLVMVCMTLVLALTALSGSSKTAESSDGKPSVTEFTTSDGKVSINAPKLWSKSESDSDGIILSIEDGSMKRQRLILNMHSCLHIKNGLQSVIHNKSKVWRAHQVVGFMFICCLYIGQNDLLYGWSYWFSHCKIENVFVKTIRYSVD